MTRVYGTSDDLIEFDGELRGEIGCFGTDEQDMGVLVAFSDGTVLAIKYDKPGSGGVWGIRALVTGSMLERLEECNDPDADPYSDVAIFKAGKLSAWWARDAERVS